MIRTLTCSLLLTLSILSAEPVAVLGRVIDTQADSKTFTVALDAVSLSELKLEGAQVFKVGLGDAELDYTGRRIRGYADFYNEQWHLERIFPTDGAGAKAMQDVNQRLHTTTATMSRRKYVKQGDYIPNFAMTDQNGKFLQIRELKGKAFVLNFIFTRCTVPAMCPASTTRMSDLQKSAAEAELNNLHFVTITFDPEFDSPGILRQYANGYGLSLDNFHLLTGTTQVVQNLLRQFGILTLEEDGTINHTMATLLVDEKGRVAYRKEGSGWTVKDFLEAAKAL